MAWSDAFALSQRVCRQLARINEGRQRLEAAGKSRAEAIDIAVNSQMDEDERRRFSAFYAWQRER